MSRPRLSGIASAVPQILLAVAALGASVLAPPASGTMLAIPLTGSAASRTVNVALSHGAIIEGVVPVAGWLVLRGERAALAPALLADGTLLVAGSSRLCGA